AYSARLARKKQIVVFNKIDVPESAADIKKFRSEFPALSCVRISAAAAQNLDELKNKLCEAVHG
ncbi:MAG: GTPase ObgE, partial [Candidatus Margulisbacteria bacterium]|nr:GTPase ObgE [Candidatus Margulisiibacteriota bacterium]